MSEEQMDFVPATSQPFADAPVKTDGQAEAPEAAPKDEPVDLDQLSDEQPAEAVEATPEATEVETPEVDFEDFEWDGKTISGPKGLKDSLMMHKDYTQKTQEVASRRRDLDTIEQALKERAEAIDAEMDVRARAISMEAELKRFENVDWRAWTEQDPIAAQQARYQFDDLARQFEGAKKELHELAGKRTEAAQQDFAKRVGETRAFAEKNIQNFSPDVEKRVIDFALEQGVQPAQLQSMMSPTVFDILHKAMVGAEAMKNPAAGQPTQGTPLKMVGSRSNAPVRKSPADMSMAEYTKWRSSQGYKDPRGP